MNLERISRVGLLRLAFLAVAPLLLASCIDEDMSDCGVDYTITHTVRLHTNVDTEISTELTTVEERAFGERLRAALADVFTDHAQDLDLAFYTGAALHHHETHQIEASSSTFTLYLPRDNYRHLALANVAAEPLASVAGLDALSTLAVSQAEGDTVAGHSVGLFSARLDMSVEEQTQTFHVDLYMLNSASALVIDLDGHTPDALWGFVGGMATSFSVSDSAYSFARDYAISASRLSHGAFSCLYAASLPSRSEARGDNGAWQMDVYVTMNGSTTRSLLTVSEPLRAGQLKIIKARLADDGRIVSMAADVGVSVTLDWKEAGSHDVVI